MANCKDCIHYEPCFEYGNILDPIHGGVKCDSFKPTADVVPKSEVERLEHILNSYALQYGTVTDQQKVIDKAKREVAREIFEEIEKAIADLEYRANTPRKTVKVEELKDQVNWVLHEVVPKTIAELKKKYTEGENQCAEERG